LASYEAQQQTGNKQDLVKITNVINKLSGILPETIEKTLLTSSFTNGGQGSISALTGAEKEELKTLLNSGDIKLSASEAEALRYESADAYYDAIRSAIKAYDSKAAELAGEFVDQIGSEAFNALTLAEQETISNWFKDFTDIERNAAKDILTTIGSDSTELMAEIMNTDWQNKS
jgi:hypothetical protein